MLSLVLAVLLLVPSAAFAQVESAKTGDIEMAVTVLKSKRAVAGARLGWSVGNSFPGLGCRSLDVQDPITDSQGRGTLHLRCNPNAFAQREIDETPLIVSAVVLGEGNVTLAMESFPLRRLGVSRQLTLDLDGTEAARIERLERALAAVKKGKAGPLPALKPTNIFVAAADLTDAVPHGSAFSPDGKRLAIVGRALVGGYEILVEYAAPAWKRKTPVRLFGPTGVRYAGDSERVFVACNSSLAEVRGQSVERYLLGAPCAKAPLAVAANPNSGVGNSGSGVLTLSPEGKHLLVTEFVRSMPKSGGVDSRKLGAIVFDVETGEEAKGVLSGAGPKGVARFNRDGSRLASYTPGYGEVPPFVEIWNTADLPWKKLRTLEAANIYPGVAPSFSPDGRYVAGGGHIFEVESGRSVHRLAGPALFDPLGRFLMSWSSNARGLSFLMIGDWIKFDELPLEQGPTKNAFNAVEISADGRTLAATVEFSQGPKLARGFTRVYKRGGP